MRRLQQCLYPIVFSIFASSLSIAKGLSEVRDLKAFADYKYVALSWEYVDMNDPTLYGFQIHYCELQAWGPHRCKIKTVEKEALAAAAVKGRESRSTYIVPGLRMSTNYTFELRAIATKRMEREFYNPRSPTAVVIATKGFSAKATLCLPEESEIEVSTGPYFGGRIGVEAADGTRCTVEGDSNSPRDVYTLRINHRGCGSIVNETTVATFVLVQENLPILTHSTRRFLVLCTVQPDALTVRARLDLPHRSVSHPPGNSVDDVDDDDDEEDSAGSWLPANLDLDETVSEESKNVVDIVEVPDSRRRDARMLRLEHPTPSSSPALSRVFSGESVAQFVLMMVLVVAGAAGFATALWYTTRSTTIHHAEDTISTVSYDGSIESEPSEINFEIESVCGLSESPKPPNISHAIQHF